jgi:single-stranded-DNA-specific exonuclease
MKDMSRAVERILSALRQGEKIVVFGDYDADGITAAAVLFEFLAYLDADVHCYIPHRLREGYGLSRDFVVKQAGPEGFGLIITVDCGISNHDAVSAARELGIDVIVTDHHEPPPALPEACAVLNPKQSDCPSGFTWLAGVGVAFNLVLALRKSLRDEGFWENRREPNLKEACDLVALGTVADMVPLVEENRIFVKAGLEVFSSRTRPGFNALLNVSKVQHRSIETADLAYKIAPRLNAAGRIQSALTAFTLLTTRDDVSAYPIAEQLDKENAKRQHLESAILTEIVQNLENDSSPLYGRALVLAQAGWHQGVLGIVASRLVEKYRRPVVLIALSDGTGKGSARSPHGFDLYEGLKSCSRHLEQFGGHKAAAGLTLKAEALPAFRKDFEGTVARKTDPADFIPELLIDAEVDPSEINADLVDGLEALGPFGMDNPEPLLLLRGLEVLSARDVGTHHLQMRLRSSSPAARGSRPMDAIVFNSRRGRPHPRCLKQTVCHIRWNRWQGAKTIQLVIRDFEVLH